MRENVRPEDSLGFLERKTDSLLPRDLYAASEPLARENHLRDMLEQALSRLEELEARDRERS